MILLVVIINMVNAAIYAEAPELQSVMPNSWKRITRLGMEEEASFLQKNKTLLDDVVIGAREPFESGNMDGTRFNIRDSINRRTRIYREQIGESVFLPAHNR
jgi:hypothetical protein